MVVEAVEVVEVEAGVGAAATKGIALRSNQEERMLVCSAEPAEEIMGGIYTKVGGDGREREEQGRRSK